MFLKLGMYIFEAMFEKLHFLTPVWHVSDTARVTRSIRKLHNVAITENAAMIM